MSDDVVKKRLEKFFEISSLFCSACGRFGETHSGQIAYVPEDYGISSKDDWDRSIEDYLEWAIENKTEVMKELPGLESEWKNNCESLKIFIQNDVDIIDIINEYFGEEIQNISAEEVIYIFELFIKSIQDGPIMLKEFIDQSGIKEEIKRIRKSEK